MIPPAQTELSVIQGFQALLSCAAQGSPEPRVSWEKDGAIVPNLPGKFTVLRSGELIIERAEVSLSTISIMSHDLCAGLGLKMNSNHFLHTAGRCRCVHMCGHQCGRLCETRHQPVHQHEACLQGVARWYHSEQRTEPGLVLPRSGNTFSCHLLDCQQHSFHRYHPGLNSTSVLPKYHSASLTKFTCFSDHNIII